MKYYECKFMGKIVKQITSRQCFACWEGQKAKGEVFARSRAECVKKNAKPIGKDVKHGK